MKTKLLLFFILSVTINTFAQDIQESLFKDVRAKIDEAKKESVNLMSPSFFNNAMEIYKEAQADYKDGASLSGIKEQIAEANNYLDKAFKTSEVGKVTFASVLKARTDALKAESDKNVPELWKLAEDRLRSAGEDLEDGDVNDARDGAKEAEDLFRNAELEAIKIAYLVETRKSIQRAEDNDVTDTAPVTLALAKKLVSDCETELNNNRYDTDLPRSLAQRAQYEISHAFFIDKFINDYKNQDRTLESLILDTENELAKIAGLVDAEQKFDNGLTPVADNIASKVELLISDKESLTQTVASLEQELKVLKDELSGLSAEKSDLAGKMERLNTIKKKYEAIDKMFSNQEAQILRKENDVIIRLVGLSFDVGQAVIKPENFGLLTKLQKAIKEFPDSKISIEGHTDSFGGDASNLQLSQKRADAVTQYLLANMSIDRSKVSSVGYGETKPIANNETKEGRAKNRRIDLIIHND